jgi:hypothetical protein
MFGRKKKIVLTESYCYLIETLRLALEVLTGERVRLFNFDFNTEKGRVFIGNELRNMTALFWNDDPSETKIQFKLAHCEKNDLSDWYVARYDRIEIIKVINEDNPLKRDGKSMWIVGRSMNDRWEEPLF